jgi:deoxyribose-phosphate aldolase
MIKKISELTPEDIASVCDHTYLNRPEAFRKQALAGQSPVQLRTEEFNKFLNDTASSQLRPYAVCVRPEDINNSLIICLDKTGIKIASVVGFPDPDTPLKMTLNEISYVCSNNVSEIDFVLNYPRIKSGYTQFAESQLAKIAEECKKHKKLAKLILETSELTNEQIIWACRTANRYNLDFVKTSTGFSSAGATSEALRIMADNFPGGIKISGGVNAENVREFLYSASRRTDGYIDLNPLKIRIGESSLLKQLSSGDKPGNY